VPPEVHIEMTDKEKHLSMLKQISLASTDSKKRLEAMEAASKARKIDLASRKDEFKVELGGFVNDAKLKKV